eukprot:766090-Hanusia_phi.AAC.1
MQALLTRLTLMIRAQLHQQHDKQSTVKANSSDTTSEWKSLLRCMLYFLAIEFMLHFIHLHAISRNLHTIFHLYSKSILYLPPWEVMAVGFYMLNYTYMKFLVIWRFAMSVAKMDQIDTVDNMNRSFMQTSSRRPLTFPFCKAAFATTTPLWDFGDHGIEISVSKAFQGSSLKARCERGLGRWVVMIVMVLNIYLLILSNLAILYGFKGRYASLLPHYLALTRFSYDFVRAIVFPPPPGTLRDSVLSNVIGFWWILSGIALMLHRRQEERQRGEKKTF